MTSPVPSSGDAGLVERLRYNAAIWERTAGANHPLCKDQSEAADLIESLTQSAPVQDGGVEEVAWLVEWLRDGDEWVDCHADEPRAVDQARSNGGTCSPLIRLSSHQSIVSAQAKEIERLTGERDEAMDWAHNWHQQCQSVATILGLHEPEGIGHAEAVRDKFDEVTAHAEAAERKVEELTEALTPSADTKAAYIGEFSMGVTLSAGGDEEYRRIQIPWTTIKEIMGAIRARAALNGGAK